MRLSLYYIDLKYVRELHKIHNHVQSVLPQTGKARKPFLGVIVINQSTGMKYAVLIPVDMKIHPNDTNQENARKILHIKEIT